MEPLIVLLGALAFLAFVLVSAAHTRKRQQEWAQVVNDLGFSAAESDPFNLDDLPLGLMQRGDGRGVDRVAWGAFRGREVKVFEYWYYDETTDSEGKTSRSYRHLTCAVTTVPVKCEPMTIGREGFFSRLADHIGFRDIELESEEFNRAYQIRCGDRRFATALLDPQMMEFLLSIEGVWFELWGDLVLCARGRTSPLAVPGQLAALVGFVERIPPVVRELYPIPPGGQTP